MLFRERNLVELRLIYTSLVERLQLSMMGLYGIPIMTILRRVSTLQSTV